MGRFVGTRFWIAALAALAAVAISIPALAVGNGGGSVTAAKKSSIKRGPRGPRGRRGQRGKAGLPGPAGPAGPAGLNGSNGANGADGTARAYGLIDNSGNLSRSAGVTSVSHPSTGLYCITLRPGIDPATTGIVATPEHGGDSTTTSNIAHVEFRADASDCPAGTLEVLTSKVLVSGSALSNTSFDQEFFFAVP
jgi:hypothetical protein